MTVERSEGDGKKFEDDLDFISHQINKVQWSLINKQKFYNQIIQNQRRLLQEQEKIIKHLTKKLGLTKVDLELIQSNAIAKVPNVSKSCVEDDSDSAIVLDSSYSEENKEHSDGKSANESSLKLERSVSDVLRITVQGQYSLPRQTNPTIKHTKDTKGCSKVLISVKSPKNLPLSKDDNSRESTQSNTIFNSKGLSEHIHLSSEHSATLQAAPKEQLTAAQSSLLHHLHRSQHNHDTSDSPRQRLKRSVSEKIIDKDLRKANERLCRENNNLDSLGLQTCQEKSKSTTSLRRCDSEKIIRTSFSSSLYRGFLLRHKPRSKRTAPETAADRCASLSEKFSPCAPLEINESFKNIEYREVLAPPSNHKSVLTPREVKNRNRRKTTTNFHSLTQVL